MSTTTRTPFLIFTSILLIWACLSFTSPPLHFIYFSKILSFLQDKQTHYVETRPLIRVEESRDFLYDQEGHPLGLPSFYEKDVVELWSVQQFLMDKSNQYVMVQFYAPWCYWSRRLRRAYAEAAMKLKGEAVLAKVDASAQVLIRDDYKVNGYPTMLFFVNGVYVDTYYGDRNSDDIVTWVRGKMGSLVYNVTTKEKAERILAAKSMTVLAFVDALEGTYTEELAASSKLHTDVNFYQTSCADIAKMFHIDPQIKSPALVVLKKEYGIHNHLDGQFNSRVISEFVSSSKRSLENTFIFEEAPEFRQESTITGLEAEPLQIDEKDVVELSAGNLSQFLMTKGNQYAMVQFYASWCLWSKRLRGAYAAAAMELKGVAVLSKVDASNEIIVGKEYEINEYPTMLFFVNGAYVDSYCGERSRDAIVTWVKGKMGSRVYDIMTIQEAKRILAAKSMIVFAFISALEATYNEELAAASKLHTDVNFYQTSYPDVGKMFHIDPQIESVALVVLEKESGIHNHLDDQFNSRAIAEFVSSSKRSLENTIFEEFHQESTISGLDAHPLQIDEKDVVELSAGNFSQFLMAKSNQYAMVQFYASWCYWSKRLKGAYAAAATELKGVAVLSKVDVSKEHMVGKEYGIQGYPTVLFFVNGAYVDSYYGDRSRDAIVTWVKGKMGSRMYNITTIGEAERILAAKSMIVLAFVDDLEAAYTEELVAASKLHTDVNFYQTTHYDVAKMFNIDEQVQRPALVVLKKDSGIHNHLVGEFSSRAIVKLVSSSKRPPLTTFNMEKYPKFFKIPQRLSFREDFHEDKLSTQPIWT
ncbi:hypothetical protein HS088_TW21G01670 [Tripterygium wilfordii]|uniref:Thioredoxin domain-containing protein n=1 Tax=Tripterygium wilfordii TaxID=458696 RepID=A0A7J7C5T1_TRIWF|nr:uncharacterized protein LOC119989444 [Tripterygium wilfordii]KAF5729503.1 hypothetical protein HS088_TW21G01670 [Tripterygium wilfordii]